VQEVKWIQEERRGKGREASSWESMRVETEP